MQHNEPPTENSSPHPVPLSPLLPRPLVSVLMTNYNYCQYIGAAIESVLAQTYPYVELVICDDGSTDRSLEVIEHYAATDLRIKVIAKKNGGVASAINAAFAASTGDVICTLDADDIFLKSKCERIMEIFCLRPEVGFVVHPMIIIDSEGNHLQRSPLILNLERGWIADNVINRGGRWRFMFGSGMSCRRDIAKYIFPIPEAEIYSEQDAFIYTLAPLLTPVDYVADVLTERRVHGANLSGGKLAFDAPVLERAEASIYTILHCVNKRLMQLGRESSQLDPARNLDLQLITLLKNLIVDRCAFGTRLKLLARFSVSLVNDDVTNGFQKACRLFVYGTACFLPFSWREPWLVRSVRPGGMHLLKRAIAGMTDTLGYAFRKRQ